MCEGPCRFLRSNLALSRLPLAVFLTLFLFSLNLPLLSSTPFVSTPSVSNYFSWGFDDGNTAGWVPIEQWVVGSPRPEPPQECVVVSGEYSLKTCDTLYRLHDFQDFAFETQVRLIDFQRQPIWGLSFRVNPASVDYADIVTMTGDSYSLFQGYLFEFVGTTLYLFRCVGHHNGACTVIGSAYPTVDPYAVHTLKVIASGPIIRAYLDNVLAIDVVDFAFGSGLLGIRSYPNGCGFEGCVSVTANFDNLNITPLHIVKIDVPEKIPSPTVASASRLIRVVIPSNSTFDAAQIELSTIRFGNLKTSLGAVAIRSDLILVQGRSQASGLELWFRNGDTGFMQNDDAACLLGYTNSGQQIFGCNSILPEQPF